MKLRDFAERTFWTAVAAAIAGIGSATLLDVTTWKAAAIAAATAAINAISIYARYRLSVLPDPGYGLPGLELEDA